MTTTGPVPSGPPNPRFLATIAYAGGLVTGAVLLAVEKQDRFVRFHAMQSIVTFGGVLLLHLVLMGVPVIGLVLYLPFILAVVGLWVFLMIKAWRGESYKLPYLGDLAEHLSGGRA
ncbi:MAG TPA: hypothetical protein VFV78_07310 [Vicinamibacterales bacterium]|nr:hypothetical protein [Vicinamibacterales bacterium]